MKYSQEDECSRIHSYLASDETMAELVVTFVREIPERLEVIERAFREEDFELLNRTAHQLKGAFGSYGFAELTEPARRLEFSSRETPRDFDTIRRDIDALARRCRRLSSEPAPETPAV